MVDRSTLPRSWWAETTSENDRDATNFVKQWAPGLGHKGVKTVLDILRSSWPDERLKHQIVRPDLNETNEILLEI